ncbi:hypothetical protein JXB37_07700, partial [candidate division WOR-3 bacterium]|nr:hypothetical protein [candidate division WOR-3 bacterium]
MSKSAQVMLAIALVVSLGWASGPTMLDAGLTRGPQPGGTLTELAPAPPPQAVAPASEQSRLPEPQTDQKTVLIVWADYDQGMYLVDTLTAYGHTVHHFDARSATPTVDTLSAYDAVITWSNYTYADATTLGNNLATYVDGGGRVIIAMFAYASGWGLAGRIMNEAAYQTFPQGSYGFGLVSTNWLDPSHPITAGLSAITDYFRGHVYAASSATVLGTWANGYDFCALSQNGEVVGITMHPGQAGNTYRVGPWGTLFHQAIEYSATTYTNDVGVQSINEPGTYEPSGTPVTPEATVRNYGSASQNNFDVVMEVDGVEHDRVTITTALAPDSTVDVEFDSWTPGSNLDYLVEMYTALAGDSNPGNDTKSVTVKTKDWVSIPPPTTSPHRVTHATCYDPVNDMLYMTGGCPAGMSGTNVTTHQRYDPVLQEWTDMAPMPDARGWIQSSYLDGKIYVVGGYTNASSASNTNYEYDIATNTWTTRAPLTRSTLAHTQVVWNDQLLYVLGGYNMSSGVNNVDVYDPVANTWSPASPMPYMSDMYSATIVGDTIIIAQSYNRGGGACWSWLYKGGINPANPTQITWIQGPAMNPPVFNGGTAALGTDVYWLGGFEN